MLQVVAPLRKKPFRFFDQGGNTSSLGSTLVVLCMIPLIDLANKLRRVEQLQELLRFHFKSF